ncbi:MAG: hypothetical protein MH204_04520 [Fimbriimonadaceae bacterium]|nr:hypothetical protein [Fimbriimonadaceae bacterium]
MRWGIILLAVGLVLAGCGGPEAASGEAATGATQEAAGADAKAGGGGGLEASSAEMQPPPDQPDADAIAGSRAGN